MLAIGETPEANFKKWFGQSRVVDASGAPLVLYHASTADFVRFKRTPKDMGMHLVLLAKQRIASCSSSTKTPTAQHWAA